MTSLDTGSASIFIENSKYLNINKTSFVNTDGVVVVRCGNLTIN
jgi:hypothetical protein